MIYNALNRTAHKSGSKERKDKTASNMQQPMQAEKH
jgi:hypothetical protein